MYFDLKYDFIIDIEIWIDLDECFRFFKPKLLFYMGLEIWCAKNMFFLIFLPSYFLSCIPSERGSWINARKVSCFLVDQQPCTRGLDKFERIIRWYKLHAHTLWWCLMFIFYPSLHHCCFHMLHSCVCAFFCNFITFNWNMPIHDFVLWS